MDLKQHGWYLLYPRVTVPKHSFQKILLDISNVKNKLKSYSITFCFASVYQTELNSEHMCQLNFPLDLYLIRVRRERDG